VATADEYLGQDEEASGMIDVNNASKRFVLHNQGGTVLQVMAGANLRVEPGECVALTGASGAGKSTLMRMIWGNYRCDDGSIRVAGLEMRGAAARDVLALRRTRLGYVSQFLRVIPRVPALDVVAEPLLVQGMPEAEAKAQAEAMLTRLNIPPALWGLSPTTFSGGEQQRVNIARGFIHPWPVMLLDEPTASLDAANRAVVLDLILQAKARGAAILGIFHDIAARAAVCDREVDMEAFTPARRAA
jgi:alpha-D-ribose 1-methylphosphonate 5-triphosphate synthase subunit PhnL